MQAWGCEHTQVIQHGEKLKLYHCPLVKLALNTTGAYWLQYCSVQSRNRIQCVEKRTALDTVRYFRRGVRRCVMCKCIYIYIHPFLYLLFSSSLNIYVMLKNASAEGANEKKKTAHLAYQTLYLIVTEQISWKKKRTHPKWMGFFVKNCASKKRAHFRTMRFLRGWVRLNAQNALWIDHWYCLYLKHLNIGFRNAIMSMLSNLLKC